MRTAFSILLGIVSLCVATTQNGAMAANKIDGYVESALRSGGIKPSEICSDEVFVRRLYLTLTGRLPDAQIAAQFIGSKSRNKRAELIDVVLESPEYVDYQVLKWGDLLRIKSEFPSNIWPNAVQAYNRWLKEQIRANVPYDQFVRNILVCSGSNFRVPQVNFYRAFQKRDPKVISDNVALLFMGMRSAPEGSDMFFGQLRYKNTGEWKEEIVYLDPDMPVASQQVRMADGKTLVLSGEHDLRKVYADWLTSAENPFFARAMANRVWYWLMGRGIVHEPDDIRDDNPASNPELLAFLQNEFIACGFDTKQLFRLILNSDAFSRSSLSTKSNVSDVKLFSHYPTVRLTAEQVVDAIGDISGIRDRYISRVPEPYSYFPADIRAVQLGDGTVTSSQIEMFGRPSRDVSLESDRNNSVTSKQVLYLLNSAVVLDKIDKSEQIKSMVERCADRKQLVDSIYLMMLSRYPDSAERQTIDQFAQEVVDNKQLADNVVWALMNSAEFLFNH